MSTVNSLSSPAVGSGTEEIYSKLVALPPDQPFDEIGLALSGGGFRAAAFSLGALSYLDRMWYKNEQDRLLKHVTFITSTSGGSITNAYYSVSSCKADFDFKKFYNELKSFLTGDQVLEKAVDFLGDTAAWDEKGKQVIGTDGHQKTIEVSKNQNLINSFAKAYDALLFKGAQFDAFFQNACPSPLKAVCLNSTELNNGISFRFQTNGKPENVNICGNYYLHFNDPSVVKQLKISDMVAASSCFPSGFEPIVYPADFIHPGLTDVNQMLNAIDYKNNNPLNLDKITGQPFCLVDGGVVDNQGLYSLMMEDNFRRGNPAKKKFDVMMVCDVGSFFMDAYQPPPLSKGWGKLSVQKLQRFLPIGVVVFIASVLLLAFTNGLAHAIGLFFLLSSFCYAFFYLFLQLKLAQTKASFNKSSWGKMLNKYLGKFARIKLNRIQQMIADRVSSTLLITTDLFLKQIRRQYYETFYNMPAYKDRTLSCFIYEFSAQHEQSRLANLAKKDAAWWNGQLVPSQQMRHVATEATAMATTLWFNEGMQEKQLMRDNIIACGQFTMCYNMLKRIYRLEVLDSKWKDDLYLQALKKRLLEDWDMFNKNPLLLVSM